MLMYLVRKKLIQSSFICGFSVALVGCTPEALKYGLEELPPNSGSYYASEVHRGYARFTLPNLIDDPICVKSADFSNVHPPKPLFVVKRAADGMPVKYVGRIQDRPVYFEEPSYIIIYPRRSAEVTIDVAENYEVEPGKNYEITYYIPVTSCEALLKSDMAIPSPTDVVLFFEQRTVDDEDQILHDINGLYHEWSNNGHFRVVREIFSI